MVEPVKRNMETVAMLGKMVSLHCIHCGEIQAAPMTPEKYVEFLDKHDQCGPKAVGGMMNLEPKMDREL